MVYTGTMIEELIETVAREERLMAQRGQQCPEELIFSTHEQQTWQATANGSSAGAR